MRAIFMLPLVFCGCSLQPFSPTRIDDAVSVRVSVRAYQSDVPIAGASVFVNSVLRGITDATGATVIAVPRAIECTVRVDARDRVSFTAIGTVSTAGESWTFWLFPLE